MLTYLFLMGCPPALLGLCVFTALKYRAIGLKFLPAWDLREVQLLRDITFHSLFVAWRVGVK